MYIISGNKNSTHKTYDIIWIDATSSIEPLLNLVESDKTTIKGQYFIDNVNSAWISLKIFESIQITRESVKLSDISECRTGIYTGDNQTYCGYDSENPPKRKNGHPVNWDCVVHNPSDLEKQIGIDTDISYVPFIRGGHRGVFDATNSCIRWDKHAVNFYDKDKKARLQNKSFYFKKGLAIPMVTSGRLSASEMENCIFDQGVVGVFALNDRYHDFLLIYLNHPFATLQKSLVAPGANNSANYLKRINVPKLSQNELNESTRIVELSKTLGWEKTQAIRDEFILSLL